MSQTMSIYTIKLDPDATFIQLIFKTPHQERHRSVSERAVTYPLWTAYAEQTTRLASKCASHLSDNGVLFKAYSLIPKVCPGISELPSIVEIYSLISSLP